MSLTRPPEIMHSAAVAHLLQEVRAAHRDNPSTRGFCDFPTDLVPQALAPCHRPCADYMAAEGVMEAESYAPLRDAMLGASGEALWRETYAHTDIGQHFMDRFGCYCIIGKGGWWSSETMSAYIVYMPPGFWYTWHHHPAEEMYLVVAGEAEFLRNGAPTETLTPGGASFHASNQPHAMQTHGKPVLAYVIWRNNLGIPPVLTPPEMLE